MRRARAPASRPSRAGARKAKRGDLERATLVLDRMAAHFAAQGLNRHVVDSIRDQAESEKARLAREYRG